MFFVHCDRCHKTLRAGALESNDIDVESRSDLETFHAEHAGCAVRLFEPTGRSTASGPWHEPSSERWIEVRDRHGLAVAIGTRTSIDDPIDWRIENLAFDEEIEIALDRELFWDDVEGALQPHQVPERQIAAWANRVDNYLRTVASSDLRRALRRHAPPRAERGLPDLDRAHAARGLDEDLRLRRRDRRASARPVQRRRVPAAAHHPTGDGVEHGASSAALRTSSP